MKWGVVSSPHSWYVNDLKRAAAVKHIAIETFSFSDLACSVGSQNPIAADRIALQKFDRVIVRSMPPGSLEQVVFRMNALQQFAGNTGTPVINSPRSLEISIDKYLCLAKLEGAGLPVPKTKVSQTVEQAMEDFQELGSSVVVKPIFGGEGRGLLQLRDIDLAWRTFKTLTRTQAVIYQQQWIEPGCRDLRILFCGEKWFAANRHNLDDWRSNVQRGGTMTPATPSEEQIELADRARIVSHCQLAGVDLLVDQDGKSWLLEVNAVPGWKALASCLNVDIAAEVINLVERQEATVGQE